MSVTEFKYVPWSTFFDTDFRFNNRVKSLLDTDPEVVNEKMFHSQGLQRSSSSTSLKSQSSSTIRKREKSPSILNDFRVHQIQSNETLENIAKKYGTNSTCIKLFNGLTNRNLSGLKTLKIPNPKVDMKLFKEALEKEKKEKQYEKSKQMLVAFKGRTLIQDNSLAEQYIKQGKGNYYKAALKFHQDEAEKHHKERFIPRPSIRSNRKNKMSLEWFKLSAS